jgi:PIN domain nuclease of toxin-antitoxin system
LRVLLDTQVWLWMQAAPGRLSEPAMAAVRDARNELYFSAASSWEIAIKHALGKLELPLPPAEYVPSRMAASGTAPLAVTHAHALRVAALPAHHRDPFDRILVAQAQVESLVILTADPRLEAYDVETLRAG